MKNERNTKKLLAALTFDDGPNTTTTIQVLEKLEKYGVRATFFLVGNNITAETEEVVRRTHAMGCEIANHSKTHSDMTKLTPEEMRAEIAFVSDKVKEITGEAPRFFRPPYIAVDDRMYDNIHMPFICGVGCNDWEDSVTAKERTERILEQVKDGVIILLHDSQGNFQTVEALDCIIPAMLDADYQFVTVSELFASKGIEINKEDKNLYTFVE